MKNNGEEWPEPIVRVQSLSESCLSSIPDRYVRDPQERPMNKTRNSDVNIPVIDLGSLDGNIKKAEEIDAACRTWGFFQIINHGVDLNLVDLTRESWRQFFHSPMELKQAYANSPVSYEGYGSRLGVQKGAILDWSDYFFLHYLPHELKDTNKWPSISANFREVVDEYGKQVVELGKRLLRVLSLNLGLEESTLLSAFGGEEAGACLRINYYPKCPQPDLTLGLSPHSDPGGMTLLLPDKDVVGLQVRKDGEWITVKPASHAFIVNIGDQIQVLSNAIYKSVDHRVIVNLDKERLSLAFFFNPKSTIPISPVKELVTPEMPALYKPMTFDEYRRYIRVRGLNGKSQLDSLKSTT